MTNCSLPSISYGRRKSCSIKHKVTPQQKYDEAQADVQATWAAGEPVVRLIGYDAGNHDQRRYAHSKAIQESEKERYLYRSPLLTAEWDRKRCQDEIANAGLPVPEKSSCYFCASVKPDEVRSFKQAYLVFIVAMEARAEAYLTNIDGLWRKAVKGERGAEAKPGKITNFIRSEGLLSGEMIDHIVETIPKGRVTPAMVAQGVQHVRIHLAGTFWKCSWTRTRRWTPTSHPRYTSSRNWWTRFMRADTRVTSVEDDVKNKRSGRSSSIEMNIVATKLNKRREVA